METSRRKWLEQVAVSRLTANADNPYDYLWGEGADVAGQWCRWSEYEAEDFTGQIESLDLPWAAARIQEIENGAPLESAELAQWRRAMCFWHVKHRTDHGLMAWIMPVRTDSRTIEAYAVWLDLIGNPASTAEDITLFGIFESTDEARAALSAGGALS
jgi:hypothetical protein